MQPFLNTPPPISGLNMSFWWTNNLNIPPALIKGRFYPKIEQKTWKTDFYMGNRNSKLHIAINTPLFKWGHEVPGGGGRFGINNMVGT